MFRAHAAGYCGFVDDEVRAMNRRSIDDGHGWVCSAYAVFGSVRVFVRTLPDWSQTVVATPRELREMADQQKGAQDDD